MEAIIAWILVIVVVVGFVGVLVIDAKKQARKKENMTQRQKEVEMYCYNKACRWTMTGLVLIYFLDQVLHMKIGSLGYPFLIAIYGMTYTLSRAKMSKNSFNVKVFILMSVLMAFFVVITGLDMFGIDLIKIIIDKL